MKVFSVDGICLDARYAVRAMRKRPGFTALAVATLALGVAVNTASIAVAYGVLVRPLPYAQPSRIVIINLQFADGGELGFAPSVLQDWLSRLRTVESAAGYHQRDVTVRSAGRSLVVPAALVTSRFLDVLGTQADFGQLPLRDDVADVVIGRRWMNQFARGETTELVNAPVSISDRPHMISGIMPSDFAFPNDEVGVWVPSRTLTGYSKIVARLKPGVTIDQVREDANRVRLELNPKSREVVSVDSLGESVVGGLRRILTIALVGALLVLLVACANVATLFIGRDVSRRHELGARMALGATGPQLVRAVVVETSLTALLASSVGGALGAAMLGLFANLAATSVPGLHRVAMDAPVVFSIGTLTFMAAFVCAAVPAWRVARAGFSAFIQSTTSPRQNVWHLRGALVVAQIALSCVLLIGAGLLTRTVSALMREDHGFEPRRALEAKVVLSDRPLMTETAGDGFVRGLLARVRAMPGVQHAGFGSSLPPRTPLLTMQMRMVKGDRDESRFLSVGTATPGYLRALGAHFVDGRDFDEAETQSRAAVVILGESTARFFFQDEDPVGRTIPRLPALGMDGDPRVVGVVSDIKYEGLDSPPPSALYVPWDLRPPGSGYLIVRASEGDPMRFAPDIRRAALGLDPTVPVPELQSLEAVLSQSISHRRVRALPAVSLGVLALCVACVGVLAIVSTFVAERRRDLAIRAVLGASPAGLILMVVGQGLQLTTLGLLLGLSLGGAAARSLSSLVYGVSPYDALTFVGAAAVIGAGATVMTCAAALRARSIDPLVVLKYE